MELVCVKEERNYYFDQVAVIFQRRHFWQIKFEQKAQEMKEQNTQILLLKDYYKDKFNNLKIQSSCGHTP